MIITTEVLYWASGISGEERSWAEAEAFCALYGGHLVDMNDESENALVAGLAAEGGAWIGASDGDVEGTWVFTTMLTWATPPWADGQPDGGVSENCALLSAGAGLWSDVDCSVGQHFVCERSW